MKKSNSPTGNKSTWYDGQRDDGNTNSTENESLEKWDGNEYEIDEGVPDNWTVAQRDWSPVYHRQIVSSAYNLNQTAIHTGYQNQPKYSTASTSKTAIGSVENLRRGTRLRLANFFGAKSRDKSKLSASTGSVVNRSESFLSNRFRRPFGKKNKWKKDEQGAFSSSQLSVQSTQSLHDANEVRARLAEPEPSLSDESLAEQHSPGADPESAVPVQPQDPLVAAFVPQSTNATEPESKTSQASKSKSKSKKGEPKSGGIFGLFRRRVQTVMPLPSVIGQRTRKESESTVSDDEADQGAMKSAFYNVAVFGMAACCVCGALAAYYLFYEFVKPVLWAVICGIVTYPLKRRVTTAVRAWLDYLTVTGTPLTLGVLTLPLKITNSWGEFLLDAITNNLKTVLILLAAFPTAALLLHMETLPRVLVTTKRALLFVDRAMNLFQPIWVPILLCLYIIYVCFCNFTGRYRHRILCHPLTAWSIWTAGLGHLCNYFGPLRTLLFSVAIIMCTTYYIPLFRSVPAPADLLANRKKRQRMLAAQRSMRQARLGMGVFREEPGNETVGLDAPFQPIKETPADPPQPNQTGESNVYLKRLFIICFFLYVSLHMWILLLLVIPIGMALIRRLIVLFKVNTIASRQWRKLKSVLGDDAGLILPPPLIHFLRVLVHIDRQVIYTLRHSMDFVGSLTAIIMLTLAVTLACGFVAYQLYYESMHLVQLSASIANQTLTQNPALQKWLRETTKVESVAELADEASKRAFTAGRKWLSEQVHEIVQNDPEKAQTLESEVLTAFDALFERWKSRGNQSTGELSPVERQHKWAISYWADAWTIFEEDGEMHFMDYLQEHLSVALALADSAWLIIKNNMETLFLAFTQIGSTVLASGTAVIDFFLDMVVFLTFLLYVLSESDDEYKPLKMIREMIPGGRDTASTITGQVEEAVNGVFFATSKIALFYGLLTWLTHTLFAVNLVFIPSVLAALFSAIPFFGAYFVVLPAALELWIIRGEPFLAVLLFSIHYLPIYVVDDAIYSEITLTTPLLSGMAIAGGILWWGVEGAVFGPLVLCFILVLGGVYKTLCFQAIGSASTSAASSRRGSNVTTDLMETTRVIANQNHIDNQIDESIRT